MDSFEWNKIAGAVLFALLVSVGLSIFSDTLFSRPKRRKRRAMSSPWRPRRAVDRRQPRRAEPIRRAAGDRRCRSRRGLARRNAAPATPSRRASANKVGPNLYGVVNRPIAAHEGYEYAEAMHAYAEEAKTWTFENLNTFLHDPKGAVPGTKMAFAGLKDDAERANVHRLSPDAFRQPGAASCRGRGSAGHADGVRRSGEHGNRRRQCTSGGAAGCWRRSHRIGRATRRADCSGRDTARRRPNRRRPRRSPRPSSRRRRPKRPLPPNAR